MRIKVSSLWAVWLLGGATKVFAGPPFVTDDPEPVDYRHGEFYLASQHVAAHDGWSGTAPHFEVNYGVVPDVQLHLIVPLAYDAPSGSRTHYGYGDTELGVKYRFVQESDRVPQVAVFPLLSLPSGSEADGLGSGQVRAFLPVWLQKSLGEWTVYGGGGYGINPGTGNEDWGLGGVVLQRHVTDNVVIGTEVYHRTPTETDGRSDTAFNVGTLIDLTEQHHLLVSAGRSIDGPTDFQVSFAYQFTFGPAAHN